MAPNIILIFLLALNTILFTATTASAMATRPTTTQNPVPQNFIQQQCQETLYFQLCVRSLSQYIKSSPTPTPAEIAQITLRISLVKARSARAYINQVANQLNTAAAGEEYQSVKDCLAQITDSVDQIAHSVAEFGRLMSVAAARENEFFWHQSNVVTWLSTASTDALACMNGFPGNAIGRKTKRMIRAKVLNVAQVNSNALALVNRFVKKHRAASLSLNNIIINKP